MNLDLAKLDAVGALSLFRQGKVSPVEFAEAIAERASDKSELNSLQFFDPDFLIRNAKACADAHPDGALSGLPLVVKDNINTTVYPTSGGTTALLENMPQQDAQVIKALQGQGGFVGAKAGMHELALGITSNNDATGTIRNPHDPSLIPGGSSGGTAAAIAAGIFPAGLGTDTGGSCRIPASLCGVVGYRPSMGRYSGDGVIPVSFSRDTVGPFARSVRDIALLDGLMASEDTSPVERDPSTITLGVPRQMFFDNLDPHVESVIEQQLTVLSRAGVKLIDVDISGVQDHLEPASFPVVFYEIMRGLPAYLKAHAPKVSMEKLLEGVASPDVAAAFASQEGDLAISESVYRKAMDVLRPAMRKIYMSCVEDNGLDGIIFPTTPLPARPIGQDETVTLNGAQEPTFPIYIRNTDLSPNIGTPGISLPCPVSNGLPVGIELDGLPGADRDLLGIAQTAERLMAQ